MGCTEGSPSIILSSLSEVNKNTLKDGDLSSCASPCVCQLSACPVTVTPLSSPPPPNSRFQSRGTILGEGRVTGLGGPLEGGAAPVSKLFPWLLLGWVEASGARTQPALRAGHPVFLDASAQPRQTGRHADTSHAGSRCTARGSVAGLEASSARAAPLGMRAPWPRGGSQAARRGAAGSSTETAVKQESFMVGPSVEGEKEMSEDVQAPLVPARRCDAGHGLGGPRDVPALPSGAEGLGHGAQPRELQPGRRAARMRWPVRRSWV